MTREEFDGTHNGQHVRLRCKNHPEVILSCKRIAVTLGEDGIGRYNGSRNIFDVQGQCQCPLSDLQLILE